MNFLGISLIFLACAVVGSFSVSVCYNKGGSTNLLHMTLVITAAVCCWLLWAIVYMAQMKPLIVPILKGEGE